MASLKNQPRRAAIKRLRSLVNLLIIAAVLNVVLAWACAIWSDPVVAVEDGVDWQFMPTPKWNGVEPTPFQDRLRGSDPHASEQWWTFRRSFGLDRRALVVEVDMSSPNFSPASLKTIPPLPEQVETRAGWPLLSMHARQWLNSSNPSNRPYSYNSVLVVINGTAMDGLTPTRRVMPTGIIWGGFAGNTLLFAAAAWFMIHLWWFVRASRRARGNCCSECGYPIGVSELCTECGTSIQQANRRLMSKGRFVRRFVWCIPVGGLLSSALAWLCALYAPPLYTNQSPPLTNEDVWWTDVSSGVAAVERIVGLGFCVDVFEDGSWGCHVVRGGWPMSVCEHSVEFWEGASGRIRTERVHQGMSLPEWLQGRGWDRKYLPMRVRWQALAVNALAWAAMLAILVQVLAMVRRRDTLPVQ